METMINKIYTNGIVHASLSGGHRNEYVKLFCELFCLQPSFGRIKLYRYIMLLKSGRLLFSSLDDDLTGFVIVSISRAIIGKRTVALLMSPNACFAANWKGWLRRWIFVIVRRMRSISVFTIVPHTFDVRFAQVSDGWLHDPQLWDQFERLPLPQTPMSHEVQRVAGRRKIISFLGRITREKGACSISALLKSPQWSKEVLFVVAGPPGQGCETMIAEARAAGALIIDKRIDDDELRSLYGVSDMIWCKYAPEYDQASGIFGRALQFGRKVLANADTVVASYLEVTGANAVIVAKNVESAELADIIARRIGEAPTIVRKGEFSSWRKEFVDAVRSAM